MSTASPAPFPEKTTGRYLVLIAEEALAEGLRVSRASDVTLAAVDLKPSGAVLFDMLGIAVIHPEPKQLPELMASVGKGSVLAIEEDRVVYAIPEITQLAKEVSGMSHADGHVTWGLQATRVDGSRWSGKGIKVAVLDTGLDLQHPDFVGRTIVKQSFVPGETIQDCH